MQPSSEQEREFREAIRRYFGECTPATCDLIANELLAGGFQTVLRKLGLPPSSTPDQQYAMVLVYIRKNGEAAFRDRMAGIKPPEVPPAPPLDPPTPRGRAAASAPPVAEKPQPARATAAADTRTDSASGTNSSRRNVPLKPGIPPKPGTFDDSTPAFDPNKPNNPAGEWPAVERRSGRERRRTPDPRGQIDVVYRNRRFGKDRRSGKERRKNWPKGGFIE